MTATTLTLRAAVRSNGGSLPLFNGEIALHGRQLEQIKNERTS